MDRRSSLLLAALIAPFISILAQEHPGNPADTIQRAATDTTQRTNTDTTQRFSDQIPMIDPATLENPIWIGIHGTIGMVGPNSFFLDHGDSTVIVGLAGEALREHDFAKGQKVTVFGRVDNDLFEKNIIKARAVAVEGIDGAGHSVISEQDRLGSINVSYVPASMVHGRVSAVTETRVVLDHGDQKISIDTSELSGDQEKPQVKQGDLVMAEGTKLRDLWGSHTFKASSIKVIDPTAIDLEGQKAGTDRIPNEQE